jgi:hypothetical protein
MVLVLEVNKVYFCDKCMQTLIVKGIPICPNCKGPMEEIGFVEDKVGTKGIGGSTKPGNCGCGNPRASKGLDELGRRRYRTQCYQCVYKARLLVKATRCKICGISPENKSDLHIDHIDGNRSNNSTNNIQTLCVECHKYKTNKQQDWKKKNV